MSKPDVPLSFVMPCFNEEEVIAYTIPRFLRAFRDAGHDLQLVACDNGSTDRTGAIIRGFAEEGLPVVYHRIDKNVGYGHGVLQSIALCDGTWIGVIPADGQVDAEDVVRLYESVRRSDGMVLGKARRRFRMDGPVRSVVSACYNAFIALLWPRLGSFDVNGSPKLIHRDILRAMALESKDWLLDSEMMIKAHYMGVRVLEINVFARMREQGTSHVCVTTAWAFFKTLLAFRFGGSLSGWRREIESRGVPLPSSPPSPSRSA